MKKYISIMFVAFLSLVSAHTMAQNKGKVTKEKQKPTSGFEIIGTLTGYPEGVEVALLNGNSGAPEGTAKLKDGKFRINGDAAVPDFKLLMINNEQPYITLFLDNNFIFIAATKGKEDNAIVNGSKAHNDFRKFSTMMIPYEKIVSGEEAGTEEQVKNATTDLNKFIAENPASFITPLAIYRAFQMDNDEPKLDSNYSRLSADVKKSSISQYLASQIEENRKHPIGKAVVNFSQADTDGKLIELASYKGKYVLIDFWASWCKPCRIENPNVVEAFNNYKAKNFTVLGVSLDQKKPAWVEAIAADGLTWQHVSDLKGWSNDVAAMYDVKAIPQNFLIDPNGILIGKNLRGEALQAKLAKIFN